MNSKFQILKEIIKERRSVYPQFYKKANIDDTILNEIIELASWAPTHKMTEPWRFVVMKDAALVKLSNYLGDYYKKTTGESAFSDMKLNKAKEKPLQSSAVIAICIERSSGSHIPEWEETAAVACAVQNMWLAANTLGLVGYWSSPAAISEFVKEFDIENATECIGFFFLGWPADELPTVSRMRKGLDKISFWLK